MARGPRNTVGAKHGARAGWLAGSLWRMLHLGLIAVLSAAMTMTTLPQQTAQASGTRTLSFKQMHTGETLTVTYKRNGRYDRAAMKRINYILRDWRRNESVKMDPKLIDLLWEVHRATGSKKAIHVLSGYRSPVTNAMLRRRSRGVARKSQHTLGRALDFYIPDVPLSRLRKTAMRMQRGGVGYYPRSGSPFVHLDVSRVRSWPRMTRGQLLALFPNGETLHLPSSGAPLPGYQRAQRKAQRGQLAATYNGGDRAPRGGGGSQQAGGDPSRVTVADAGGGDDGTPLLARLTRRAQEQPGAAPQPETVAAADSTQDGAPETIAALTDWTAPQDLPLPRRRPGSEDTETVPITIAAAPMPRNRPLIADVAGNGTQFARQLQGEQSQLSALARSRAPDALTIDPSSGSDARQALAQALAMRTREMSSDRTIAQLIGINTVYTGGTFGGMAHPSQDDYQALMGLEQPVVLGTFSGPVVVRTGFQQFAGRAVVPVRARHVSGFISTASLPVR